MEIKKGIPVSPGIVIKEAFILDSEDYRIPRRTVSPSSVDNEIAHLEKALRSATGELLDLKDEVLKKAGPECVPIFEAQIAMLADRTMHDEIVGLIREENLTAESATSRVFRVYIKNLRAVRDGYLSERVVDVQDIQRRLQRHLLGERREDLSRLSEQVILIAHNLTPSRIARLDREKVVGIALDGGGRTSHTAIMARAMGIPAVVGLETISADVSGGDTLIIDGNRGTVIIDPDEETLERYEGARRRYAEFSRGLRRFQSLPAKTKDGVLINMLANVEFPWEISKALEAGAGGVGLYRTEFLYAHDPADVTEEQHFEVYSRAVEQLQGRELVIRTMDIGADKFYDDEERSVEPNPFLGLRSIRLCLQNTGVFKTQLRAVLRASALSENVKLMFPMISSLKELRQARAVLAEAMEELDRRKTPYNKKIPVGIMVEVPSVALTADLFAKEADFFSIGTNDLIQYCLAVDRVNERLAYLYQPGHPAVLRLVSNVIKAGHKHNIKVSMCGEMSGEATFAILLVGMGLREISTTPAIIPEIKQVIRSISESEAKRIARKAMKLDTAEATMEFLNEKLRKLLPDFYTD
ncbi:MAG: phosphoenolpyruvate--protein phosphotransferase [Planctomycetota bacterium]